MEQNRATLNLLINERPPDTNITNKYGVLLVFNLRLVNITGNINV